MPIDERIQTAINNWLPRFIANGIDFNDFQRVTAPLERWDDWCSAWSACGALHAQLGEQAEAQGHFESASEHYFQAAIAYHFGKYLFVHRPEELHTAHMHAVELYQRAMPHFALPAERVTIPYEHGETIPAILRKPQGVTKPPLVVLVPGLDSVKEELHNYSEDFLRRGMATLAIDGPGQGELEFRLPLRHDYEVPLRYVIDYLATRSDIDSQRLGLLGVSLGGHFAPRIAVFEPRLKAAISISGAYHLHEHFTRYPSLTQAAFIARTKSSSSAEAIAKLQQFDLTGVINQLHTPLLIIAGRKDRLFPPEEAYQMHRDAGATAELWMFDDGNHVCNNIIYKHRPQQADWMRQHLSQ